MSDVFSVQCPYCGEAFELVIEEDVRGVLVQDCEVCCNPCQITVVRDAWGDPEIRIERTD